MSDASMSPALINPPADIVLGYPGDDDDETATRNESPPVTTPADHDVRPPTKPDPADTDMDPVDGAVAAEPPATAAPEPVPVDSHVQETDRKRELPTDETEHTAKRPRSDASGSQQYTGIKPRSSIPVDRNPNPLAAYTTFQEPPPPPYTGPTMLTANQQKYCLSTVRTLKRMKDAVPFLRPVDPIALNVPHYPIVIKRPMDFFTVETKLQNSNPNKTPEPLAPRYRTTDDFVADVRQIFENCYLFNGPEHFISAQARKLEDILDKQLKQMPGDEEPPRVETPPPKKTPAPAARRQSTSVPAVRRTTPDDYAGGPRPKREIHPPPPKDLPYSDPVTGKRPRKGKGRNGERDDGTADQLRYCLKILLDFNKKSLYQIAGPFYDPVDATYVPNYYKVIKKPMDLSTMRRKLDNNEYPNANAFHNDFKQMMRNCQQFNPPGTVVAIAGQEMDRIFKEKWKNLPPLRQPSPEDDDDADSSQDERGNQDTDLAIAMMESQIESIRDNLAALKAKKKKEKEKAVKPSPSLPPKEKKAPPPPVQKKPVPKKPATYAPPNYQPSPGPSRVKETPSRRGSGAAPKAPPAKKAKTAGTGSDTEKNISTMSFEQKKELSTTIESLNGDKLEKVIQIIYEGMPDLQNSSEEIELDIESLTPAVLTKLWNFVVKPQQQKRAAVSHNGPKRTSGNASKGAAATGGVKRKSMDEEVESARIRKLQEQLNKFDPGAAAALANNDAYDDDARSSNGSGSDSDSGSDSE
ncbi:unnamed protein product [Rhizoctonia solani]|uniref:Bromodomain-containing factor 1 n=1 Tax=Rhizoctonia solani TaxID=456999 RepID=A0A8H3BDU3_9AGAM|nr:unnamed protein product [Rhizoctonia solani]